MSSAPPASVGTKVSSVLIALVLVVVTVLVDVVLYISNSSYLMANDHFMGLVWIGVLGLIFSLLAYLLQAATTDPTIAHALSLGYLGFGLAVLFGAVLIAPDSAYGGSASTWTFANEWRIISLIIVLLVLVVVLVIMRWNFRADTAADSREAKRKAWRDEMAAKAAAAPTETKSSGGSGGA